MCRCGRERRVSPSDGIENEWAIVEPLIPGSQAWRTPAGHRTAGDREWHRVCAVHLGVPGV